MYMCIFTKVLNEFSKLQLDHSPLAPYFAQFKV